MSLDHEPSEPHRDVERHREVRNAGGGRTVFAAFTATIPVLLGYVAIGVAFGMLLVRAGYPVFLAPLMSVVVFAGAAQFAAVGMLAGGASLLTIGMTTLVVNARHLVYGLSLVDRFRRAGRYKPYLIFALTDETYALLTTVPPPPGADPHRFAFYISLFDQSWWVLGTVIGALLAGILPINTEGLDFALTALFAVLFLEQVKAVRKPEPFLLAGIAGAAGIVLAGPGGMLLPSIVIAVLLLLVRYRMIEAKSRAGGRSA